MNSPLRFRAPAVSFLHRLRASASRLFALGVLMVLGSLAPTQQALAFSGICNMQNQSAPTVSVKEFNTVTVSFDVVDQSNCANASGMDYSISIINGTTTGTLTSPTATGAMLPGTRTISVQASSVSGTFQIRINCTNDCSTTNQLTWNVNVENVGLAFSDPVGGTDTVGQGTPRNLTVYWGGPTIPVPGDTVSWTVTTEPSAGATTLTPTSGVTDSSGFASTSFTGAVAGSYQITASVSTGCTFCGPTSRTFDITVAAPDADTSITMSDAPDPVGPTGNITYTILASNEGPDPATSVQWTDTLPAALAFQSLTPIAGWSCTTPSVGSTGTITCSIGTLAVGAADSFDLVTSFASTPAGGSVVTNSASISAATGDVNTSNQNTSTSTVVDDDYVLVANAPTTITVAPDETAAMSVDYSVNGAAVTNNTGWVTDDPFNAFMSFSTVTGDGSSTTYNNGMTSNLPGTYTVTVSGGCLTAAPDCPPPDVSFTVIVEDLVLTSTTPSGGIGSVNINTPLGLEVTLKGPTRPAVDGTNFQWTITSEPSVGAGSLTFFGTQSTGGTGKSTNTFTGTVPGDYTISVCEAPDNCGPDVTTFTITVTNPSMTVAKSLVSNSDPDGSGNVTEGDVLTYQVVANNNGSIALTNVTVGDSLVSPSSTSCASLAVGADCTLTGTYTVTLTDVGNGTISNTGTATSTEFGPISTSPLNTTVFPTYALTVAKSLASNADNDGTGTVTEGDVLTYAVAVSNSGNVNLSNVSVSDTLVTPNSTSCPTLAPGANCDLVGTYTVTNADALAGNISNTGSASATEVSTPVTDTHNLAVVTNPSLSVVKVRNGVTDNDGSSSVTEGDTINYTITATNDGNVVLNNVSVTDALLTPTSNSCASVAIGATCVLTGSHVITQADAIAGNVTNTATADSDESAPANSNTVVTTVVPTPSLSVVKTFDGYTDNDTSSSITQGDTLNYTLTATNDGNLALTSVTVSDALITPTSASCPSVAIGATCVLTGSYTVTGADVTTGTVTNAGSASSSQTSSVSSNTVVTPISGSPSLSVAKVRNGVTDNDGSSSVTQGDTINYTITATNDGNIALNNVVVSDPLLTPTSNSCASVAVGATCVLTGSHVITAGDVLAGNVTNTASADSDESAPASSNTVVTVVNGSPALTVAKTFDGNTDSDGSSSITQGDTLNYTVTMTNTGNVPLTGVVVADPQLSPTSNSCASVAIGATCVLTGGHVVTLADVGAGNVTNTATADSNETASSNSNTVVTAVNGSPQMTLAKTYDGFTDADGNSAETQGDTLQYTLTLTNTGNVALTGVSVDDAQLTPNNATCASVPAGGTCVLSGTHLVTLADVTAGNVTNTGSATSNETAPASSNTVVTPIASSPSLSLAKVRTGVTDNDGSSSVTQGDAINYTITATNTGNVVLSNVVVSDALLTPTSNTCPSVAIGATCVLSGSHVITAGDVATGTVTNTASVDSTETTPQNSNTVVTGVVGSPAIAATKTFDGYTDNDGSSSITQGDSLAYTVTATNTGNVALTAVVVSDGQLTPASANCASVAVGGTCVLSGSHVVTSGEIVAGNVTNVASADANETTPVSSNTVITPVVGSPALSVAKVRTSVTDTDASSSVTAGDVINYTVTATNTGNIALTNVVVSDPLVTPGSNTCPSVAVGGTCVLTGSHTVTAGDASAGNVTNTASADSNETAPANSNTVVTAVVSPGLAVAKTFDGFTDNDGSTTITQGDVLDYTVTATNTGNAALTGVTVADPQITPNSANCASVAVGATCVLAGSHTVTNADVLAGNVTNTATADSTQTAPVNSNTITTTIVSSPALSIAKVRTGITDNDGSASVTVGDGINYTVTVTNTGNVALTGVVVSDPQILPASNTCASVAVGGTCVLSGSHVITAGDASTGTVTNTATADSNETAPANSNTVVTGVVNPGLVVAKTFDGFTDNDGSTTITQGDVLDYTVTATNSGNSVLTGVTVADPQITPNSTTCASVAVGATCVLAGSHTVSAGDVATGTVTNTATADSNETAPQSSNTINTTIVASPALSVAKVRTGITDNDGSASVTQGDAINYTITATNTGNVVLTNVIVGDLLITPTSTTCASVATGGTCVLNGSHIITAGDVATGTVTNTASATSDQTAPQNSNTVVTGVLGSPAVALAKTLDSFLDNDGTSTVTQGDTLEYTLTATNTGNIALTGVTVSDPQLTPASANCASVAVGGTCVLAGTHVVTAGDVAAGNVTNTGSVSTSQTGTTSSNTVVTVVNGSPALVANKTFDGFVDNDGNGAITAGDTMNYTVVATNSGNTTLTGVVVNDAQLTPASANCASVAVGATCTLTGTHVVTAGEVTAGNVTNTATATSAQAGPVSSNTVVTPVAGNPVLSITSGNNQFGLTSTQADNPLVVTLVDGAGNPIANQAITWNATGAGTVNPTSTLTNASGVAQVTLTFAATAGTVSITATTGGGANPVTFNATAQSGGIGVASGNNQTGPINTTLPLPLKVLVIDPLPAAKPGSVRAQAMDGVPVTFTVTSGGGSVSQVTVMTDANGEAATQFTLGPIPGTQTVTASISGGASVTFFATATIARTLVIASGDAQSAAPGSALPLPLVVHAQDNGVDVGGVTINWTLEPGSAPATINPSGATSGTGLASATVTVGATPGPISIRATRADDPTVFVIFNANAAQLQDIPGLTPEQLELAIVLDQACETLAGLASLTPPQADLLARCQELIDASIIDPGSVTDALDQLLPGLAAVMAEASFNAAQAQFQNLKARIAALRAGTQGNGFNGLAFSGSGGTVSLGALGAALTQDEKPAAPTGDAGSGFQRWGFFASGTIGRGEAEAGSTRPGYDYDINGLTAGLDYRYSDSFIFGGALGYTRQDTELQGAPGQMDMSGWSVSGYATWYRDNSWYTDAVLTYGHNSFDLLRTVTYTLPVPGGGTSSVSQTARSNSDGDMLEGAFTFGRDFQKGGWSIGPYGRLLYTKLDFDRIVDEMDTGAGSGLGLSIDARSLTSVASEIGAKFTYAHSTDWGVVTPHFQFEWEHEFKDDPKALTARFLADPNGTPFSLTGEEIDTDYFRFSLGLSIIMSRGRSGFLIYERTLGREGFSQDNLGFGVRIEF